MTFINDDNSGNRIVPETDMISDSLKVAEGPVSLKPDTFKSYAPPTVWQKTKEFVGVNKRVNVQLDGKICPVSINISKVAKRNGIKIQGNESFVKEILSFSKSADKTFDQIIRAEKKNVLKKMAKDPFLLRYPTILGEEETFDKAESAHSQGVEFNRSLIVGGNYRFVQNLDGSTNKTSSIALRIIRELGHGGFNRVELAWDSSTRKFVAVRTGIKQKLPDQQKFVSNTRKSRAFYEQLKKNASEEELELVEKPDVLVRDMSGETISSLRELAVDGNLYDNQMLFADKPKKLVFPLLKQLSLYVRSGIGMGDVKLDNINIHRNAEGERIPKYSDIDGGICSEHSSEELLQAWESLSKSVEGSEYDLNEIIANAVTQHNVNFGKNKSLQKSYDSFKLKSKKVAYFSTTPDYTFGGSVDAAKTFFFKNQRSLIMAFTQESPKGHKDAVRECIKGITSRAQNIDIKATGICFVMGLLGNNALPRYSLGSIGSNPDMENKVKRSLTGLQALRPSEDKLSETHIQLIIDMACGRVSSDSADMARIQKAVA
ncbi:MAG: hypothetical protein HN564_05220 [Flavobacteriales bacterium]|jgi:hypothetical protein|nr:hypothetical protein [Flavobacteriales bacterium]